MQKPNKKEAKRLLSSAIQQRSSAKDDLIHSIEFLRIEIQEKEKAALKLQTEIEQLQALIEGCAE